MFIVELVVQVDCYVRIVSNTIGLNIRGNEMQEILKKALR
jgi:hypothetical protein